MKLQAVLFDLDATLLPMDQDEFIRAYMKGLVTKLVPHGYDPQRLIDTVWAGTAAMVCNDGATTNETAFWRVFCGAFGEQARQDEPILDDFYHNEFQTIRQLCGYTPAAAQIVRALSARGVRVALATNPLFPAIATESRMRWAGLAPADFELYTTYENICYCKPNLDYYREILRRMDLPPQACLMVGNDVGDDMVAAELGMRVFLLTDHLINKDDVDIDRYPHGSFVEMQRYIDERLA